jgi:hypothetical protein
MFRLLQAAKARKLQGIGANPSVPQSGHKFDPSPGFSQAKRAFLGFRGFLHGSSLCFLLLGLGVLPLFFRPPSAWAQQAFQTQRTIIVYENPVDLLKMNRLLRFRQVENFPQKYFSTPNPPSAALSPELAAKVEGLLLKVCLILNRWPRGPQRLRIVLLKDGREVRQHYLALQPSSNPPLFGYSPLEAFYEPRTRTIYSSLTDLDEGILAHEMAHFVLCTTFAIPPSSEIQEKWAQYVEARLKAD